MIFDWYLMFNVNEFLAEDLVSRKLTVQLEGIGEVEVLITVGNEVSMTYQDVILPINFNSENPFIRVGDDASYAIYKDTNGDVYLGIEATQ